MTCLALLCVRGTFSHCLVRVCLVPFLLSLPRCCVPAPLLCPPALPPLPATTTTTTTTTTTAMTTTAMTMSTTMPLAVLRLQPTPPRPRRRRRLFCIFRAMDRFVHVQASGSHFSSFERTLHKACLCVHVFVDVRVCAYACFSSALRCLCPPAPFRLSCMCAQFRVWLRGRTCCLACAGAPLPCPLRSLVLAHARVRVRVCLSL